MAIAKGLPNRTTFQTMPVVAMCLVVMLMGLLLWILHRNEVEDARLGLIKDILWVEQNIHFHLTTGQEKLAQLAVDMEHGALPVETFEVEVRALMGNNPELVRVLLRDAQGNLAASMPPAEGEPPDLPADEGAPWWGAFTLAKSVGRPEWSPAFFIPGIGQVFEVHVPVFDHQHFTGMVVGVVSVDALLTQHVPWWVAAKYKIEVIDANGTTLGSKTMVELARPGPSHQVRLEPPGQGLAVVATVYAGETNLARNVVVAAIFALTLVSLWSLWAVRRHVRRRMDVEQALRAEHAFRKAMEDSLAVGMRARDMDGRVTYANTAFCRMVGWPAEELIGQGPPMPYWCPDALDATMEVHRRVMAGAAPRKGSNSSSAAATANGSGR
jgi:PAS domain S-box